MKITDKIHDALDCEEEANRIMLDFGFRWAMFGFGIGVVITLLLTNWAMR